MGHCEERSDEAISNKTEIAAPFELAMAVTSFLVFVFFGGIWIFLRGPAFICVPLI